MPIRVDDIIGLMTSDHEIVKINIQQEKRAQINAATRRSEGKNLVIHPFRLDPETFQTLETVAEIVALQNPNTEYDLQDQLDGCLWPSGPESK